MQGLEDVDIRTLLQLETDLSDETLDGFIEYIRHHYGLANIAYLCPSFRGRSVADPFMALTYGEEWVEHYKDEGYGLIDPVHNIGARSVLPLDWARLPRAEKKVQRLFGEAAEAGVGKQGLTIPVRGPTNGLWALFSVTSDESDTEWARRRFELTKDMVHLAHYVHQRAYKLHAKEDELDLNTITKREIEALEWSAEGKSLADISILMRISVETVKAHLDSARYKLCALNRVHAVTKAIRAGLIR
ncbi:helix-turn-helix transcriptional regulator [Methylocella silvestris]|uniref:LuxR family transcriptional regulator n=1 Tax=Methylocella silvestris TaxID=199596 RepID=A0A2J7TKL9_METSI|nr:LuxR family transcriptional regulator [Methylocella silvestris]PNG27321.1 LuxR family transcriptional regulator [Methylocella silvestris]